MRALFGVVSLLVVLAVVGWTARTALPARGRPSLAASAGAPAPVAPAQQLQRDIGAALRQGSARNDAAERRDSGAGDPVGRAPDAGRGAAAPDTADGAR